MAEVFIKVPTGAPRASLLDISKHVAHDITKPQALRTAYSTDLHSAGIIIELATYAHQASLLDVMQMLVIISQSSRHFE